VSAYSKGVECDELSGSTLGILAKAFLRSVNGFETHFLSFFFRESSSVSTRICLGSACELVLDRWLLALFLAEFFRSYRYGRASEAYSPLGGVEI